MSASIIDGKALALRIRAELAQEVATLTAQGVQPGLAVLVAGDDPASQVYVSHKARACEQAGIRSVVHRLPGDLTEEALLGQIAALNADATMDGILVQLPLPPQIRPDRVIEAIAAHKDVDGFHPRNAGALLTGGPGFRPCTPLGCMRMLESIGLADLSGRHAVVLGRSNIVGKPLALMLLAANATVTVCHSRSKDVAAITRTADIVVCATGRPGLLTAGMVKPGAVVLDVGINRSADGKLTGDADFDGVREIAGHITPVPGGVGPMTIAMLLSNTVAAARQRNAGRR